MAAESTEVLQARLAALRLALHSGVLLVRHGETSTTFRSSAELERAIRALELEITPLTTPRRRVRYITQMTKGL